MALVVTLAMMGLQGASNAEHTGVGCIYHADTDEGHNYFGDPGCEEIHMNGGGDIAWAQGSYDDLYMGSGHDSGYGEGGTDYLYGGDGNDDLLVGPGNDDINDTQGTDDDLLCGNADNDDSIPPMATITTTSMEAGEATPFTTALTVTA